MISIWWNLSHYVQLAGHFSLLVCSLAWAQDCHRLTRAMSNNPCISAPLHFWFGTKTNIMSCINNTFSCCYLVGHASGCMSIYTTKDMRSNMSHTTSASGLNDHFLTGWRANAHKHKLHTFLSTIQDLLSLLISKSDPA